MSLLFIVQVVENVQKKAQFSFCGQRKAFLYEIVSRGIQPYFLHGGALGLSVLKCNQGSDVLENFEVHLLINVSYTFYSFWHRFLKKNYKMCPDWRWRDFVLNFAVCSANFYLCKRIHDLDGVPHPHLNFPTSIPFTFIRESSRGLPTTSAHKLGRFLQPPRFSYRGPIKKRILETRTGM